VASAIDWPQVQKALERKGLRLTRPRRRVIEKLLSVHDHVSADDLAEELRRGGTRVSKATVYRTLAVLKDSGLFDAHDFGTGQLLYEPMVGTPHHDHLFCIRCRRIIEFSNEEIERQQEIVLRRYRFEALYHSHKIFGYCDRCRRRKHP
jgi:Fur family ferric uptake transcriptional regulator